MRTKTRHAFNAYSAHLAEINGVPNAAEKFAIEPSVEQTLEDRVQESADFLQEINIVGVDEQIGEKLGLGTSGPVAGRTDTTAKDREPRNIAALDANNYRCVQTNFDSYLKYAQLDAWAKFPDFQTRVRNHVVKQIARDRLMIGWNGEGVAEETDVGANPKLQDVNSGWLMQIGDQAPERFLNSPRVGDGGDYANLDALVFDAAETLLDEWHRDDPEIVAIMGRSLITDKYLSLIGTNEAPTERAALQTLLLNKTIGGRRAKVVPFFPAKAILITRPSNLSIYWQNGTHRRAVIDNVKRDRIEDFQSVNEAYVVEDFGACALIDSVLQPDGSGGWT